MGEPLALVKVGTIECEFLKLTPLSRTSAIAGAVCGVTICPRKPSGTNRIRLRGVLFWANAAPADTTMMPADSNNIERRIEISSLENPAKALPLSNFPMRQNCYSRHPASANARTGHRHARTEPSARLIRLTGTAPPSAGCSPIIAGAHHEQGCAVCAARGQARQGEGSRGILTFGFAAGGCRIRNGDLVRNPGGPVVVRHLRYIQ